MEAPYFSEQLDIIPARAHFAGQDEIESESLDQLKRGRVIRSLTYTPTRRFEYVGELDTDLMAGVNEKCSPVFNVHNYSIE
jgi:hypothetical protein